jgi:hypothetical protein
MRIAPIAATVAACGSPRPPEPPANTSSVTDPAIAVVLAAPRLQQPTAVEQPTSLRFQPLVCTIDRKLVTGARCGEVMPAHAKIRAAGRDFDADRSTRPFHDAAGEQDFAAPYGPTCCTYNTCGAPTVPYAARDGVPSRPDAVGTLLLGVWPPEANIDLQLEGGRAMTLLHRPPGPHGYRRLASTDVDHDGHREVIVFEDWANDYGVDVVDERGEALYAFSCGNI